VHALTISRVVQDDEWRWNDEGIYRFTKEEKEIDTE
jgi:hypothetical protein